MLPCGGILLMMLIQCGPYLSTTSHEMWLTVVYGDISQWGMIPSMQKLEKSGEKDISGNRQELVVHVQ